MGELHAGGACVSIAFYVANDTTNAGGGLGFGCKLLSCHFCWLQRLLNACSIQPCVSAWTAYCNVRRRHGTPFQSLLPPPAEMLWGRTSSRTQPAVSYVTNAYK